MINIKNSKLNSVFFNCPENHVIYKVLCPAGKSKDVKTIFDNGVTVKCSRGKKTMYLLTNDYLSPEWIFPLYELGCTVYTQSFDGEEYSWDEQSIEGALQYTVDTTDPEYAAQYRQRYERYSRNQKLTIFRASVKKGGGK